MRDLGIRGLSVAVFAILGLVASHLVSETLRNDARNAWAIEADSAAQSLTRTLLGWLEESYAPLSGLAALNENSDSLTEAEFLSAYDGLEARATAFFLEGAALYVPSTVEGGTGWRMKFSTDPDGVLSGDTPLSIEPALLQSIRVAEARFGELILGQPILGPDGKTHISPVALGTFNNNSNQVIVGLVDYAALVKGLFRLHVPSGAGVRISGRYPDLQGQGRNVPVLVQGVEKPIHAVTTRTVSAGAELAVTWDFDKKFSGGPQQELANLALIAGIILVVGVSLFVAVLLQRNRTITLRVDEATRELSEKESLLRMALDNMPGGMIVADENQELVLVNDQYREFYGDSDGLLKPGTSMRDILRREIDLGLLTGEGGPEEILEARMQSLVSGEIFSVRDTGVDGRTLQVVRKPAPNGHTVAVATDITEMVEAQRGARLLSEALDTFSDMVILYDSDERVIFTNDRYHEIYPDSPPKDEIRNFTMEGLVRRSLDAGLINDPLAKTDPEAWLQQTLTKRRNKDGGSGETTHKNGRTYFYRYSWTTEGGMILFQIDITQRKEAEQALAAKQAQLNNILENAQQGVVLFDAQKKLISWNARYPETLNIDQDLLYPGMPLLDLTLVLASRGDYGEGDPRELADRRVAQLYSGNFRGDVSFGEGRMFDAQSSRTPDGSIVITYTDITERKKTERIIAEAKRLIDESMQYGSRIQRALLPSDDAMKDIFSDHFLIWEPKDVVGGDMLWMRPLEEGHLLIVADCTGHGAPGAFMTMISTGALDQALREVPDGDPAEVIAHMNRVIKVALGQDQAKGESDDGVELGIVRIEGKHLTFAGARFALNRYADGQIEEIKGDRSGIGYRKISMEQTFTNHEINVSPGDLFYIWTDGVTDQIGGAKRRAFGKRRVRACLGDFHRMTMPRQKVQILRDFIEYQHNEERRDDITFFGFKLPE